MSNVRNTVPVVSVDVKDHVSDVQNAVLFADQTKKKKKSKREVHGDQL